MALFCQKKAKFAGFEKINYKDTQNYFYEK